MKKTAVIMLGLLALLEGTAQAHGYARFHYSWGCSPWYSGYYYRPYYYSSYYPTYYHSWGYEPTYVYSRPNYAVSGTLLGALAGGLIGHAAGRHGLEGAAIGATSGLFLGAAAEHSARRRESSYTPVSGESQPAPAVVQTTIPPSAPAATTQRVASPPPSAMNDANRLFGR